MAAPDYASEIAALEAAAASGELRVEQDGELVHYRSMADLLAALSYFRVRAAQAGGGGAKYGATLAVFGND